LLGTAVSATVEILQGFERSRRSSMADIYANALGSFIGAVGAIIFLRVVARMNRRRGLPRTDAGALALIVCWLLYLLFPFFPVFDTRVIAAKIPGLQEFAFIPFISAAVGWYVIGNIIRAAGFRNARVVCASSVLLIPAQLLLFRVQPTLADLLGAIVGATLFISTRNEDTARKAGAWAIISLLLIRGVWPLDIASDAQSFTWTPFLSLLEINWFRASEVLSQKLFLYGAAVWSLHRAGLRLRTAAVATAPNVDKFNDLRPRALRPLRNFNRNVYALETAFASDTLYRGFRLTYETTQIGSACIGLHRDCAHGAR
jgi:hypothetical protein